MKTARFILKIIGASLALAASVCLVIAFWDGVSKGTQYTMNYCEKTGTPLKVVRL